MATHDPDSHAEFEFLSHSYTVGLSPCSYSVDLTIIDHRRPTAAANEGCWNVMIPCPDSCNSADHYRSFIKDLAVELSTRCLNLHNCCAFDLMQGLIEVLIAGAHTCGILHTILLHVFPCTPHDHPSIDAVLTESFEAAQPKPTPASHEAIEKLISEGECSLGSDEDVGCRICLEDIRVTGQRMPCSHVFHRTCIAEWLKVSHVCPLCRYEMPIDDIDNSDQLN